jgi:hypothetical protein
LKSDGAASGRLNLDTPIGSHCTFSKNRERLMRGDIAGVFVAAVATQARAVGLLSDEHFTVDGMHRWLVG